MHYSFFVLCCMGSLIGKNYIDGYVKKTGMASLLIGILAGIIGFSTFMLGNFIIEFREGGMVF